MNIAFVQDHDLEALRVWNTGDLSESLRDQGIDCVSLVPPIAETTLYMYDVVIFYRSLEVSYSAMIQRLKDLGILVGFFIDDLIWDKRFPFAYSPPFESRAKQMFADADFHLFTSEHLAKYAPQGKPVLIRKPALLERRFNSVKQQKPHTEFRILISKAHVIPEFRDFITHTFNSCQVMMRSQVYYFSESGKTFPDRIGNFKFNHLQNMRFDNYFESIANINPDLILNPLPDDDFHNSKCYPKYLEAGAIKSCLLASDIYPYRKCIKDMETGMLAKIPADFAMKIKWASQNRGAVAKMGRAAWSDVKENHLLGPVAKQFYEDLKALYDQS